MKKTGRERILEILRNAVASAADRKKIMAEVDKLISERKTRRDLAAIGRAAYKRED